MGFKQYLKILVIYYLALLLISTGSGDYMTIYDVGQGDAILLQKGSTQVLVDGGGNYEVGRYLNTLNGYFFTLGIKPNKLESIFLTHPHADHVKGLYRTLQSRKVNQVTFNDVEYESELNSVFITEAHKKMFSKATTGDVFFFNGLRLTVLWPDESAVNANLDNVNNYSIVLLADFGEFEALLTGDAELEALEQIDFNWALSLIDLPLEVLKVPHHGSRTGLYKPMYEILSPKNCVISVGKDNSYGLPHPEVVDFIESTDCALYRTDVDGSVKFSVR